MKVNMKRITLIIAAMALCLGAGAFGRRNHATVNYIAEQHLSSKARAAVNEILDGSTLTEYGSYPDDYRLEILIPLDSSLVLKDSLGRPVLKGTDGKPFCYGTDFFTDDEGKVVTTLAHGWLADPDSKYVETPYGECIWYARMYMDKLKDWKNMDKQERFVALVCLAHLIGDMHCPTHIHYTDGWDGNDGKYTVTYAGKPARYHSVWDTALLVDRYVGGPVDFAYYADPLISGCLSKSEAKKRMKAIQEGSLEFWAAQVARDVRVVYNVKDGDVITNEMATAFLPLGRDMVMQAGYRLAKVLNDIFK